MTFFGVTYPALLKIYSHQLQVDRYEHKIDGHFFAIDYQLLDFLCDKIQLFAVNAFNMLNTLATPHSQGFSLTVINLLEKKMQSLRI